MMAKPAKPAPLNDSDITDARSRLESLRAMLLEQDSDSADARGAVELDQQSIGRLSRMDAIQQQAMAEAEARRRRSDLARIDAAFARIADGEYGWCAKCGEPIGRGRLAVDPMADHCIGCAA
jgi:DnaK suppressor protein